MTDCPNGDIRELLPDLLHGRLDATERAAVEAHLRACEVCRDELELLPRMQSALRRAPSVDVAAILAQIPPYRPPQPIPACRRTATHRRKAPAVDDGVSRAIPARSSQGRMGPICQVESIA